MTKHACFVAGLLYCCLMTGLLVLSLTATSLFAAQPYSPQDDNEVLEVLPAALISGRNEIATLRRQLAGSPTDPVIAHEVASRFLQLGKQENESRFFGYARAAIHPWWAADNPPLDILAIRAKLKETDHQYDESLADLRLIVQQQPRNLQAWMNLANIYRVQGRYEEASQASNALAAFATPLATTLCRAPILAATGRGVEAYDSLTGALEQAKMRSPDSVQWILLVQAKIALSLGREALAERHYREGRANDANDHVLKRDYAEFLLDRQRNEEVLELLEASTTDNDSLYLLTIAALRLGKTSQASEWRRLLEGRFEENRLRSNPPHGRLEARYALDVQHDPQRALEIAIANWQQQKEIRDTRNVLEAAIAAKARAAVEPVLRFLAASGTEDVILTELVRQLEQMP